MGCSESGTDEIVPLSLFVLFKGNVARENETYNCFHLSFLQIECNTFITCTNVAIMGLTISLCPLPNSQSQMELQF